MAKRVVLAMSGGVDSSVAAHLLLEQGYEVVGLFMRTGTHGAEDSRADHKKGCCSALDAGDARRVADRLDIPFYALDFEKEFDRIIDYFTDEYIAGRTPNPCVVCNNWLKFGQLWTYGQQMEADFIATGHYARIESGVDGPELHRGIDAGKDQSYVLYGLKRELLSKLLFPLGGFEKGRIREMARGYGLAVADKPDSVEICFVPDGDHASLIRERRPDVDTAGKVVDREGNELGEHDGFDRYTIGQRKGLGVASTSRRYVLDIVPDSRQVVIGEKDNLYSDELTAKEVNWLIDTPTEPRPCQVKIRYRHTPVAGEVIASDAGEVRVRLHTPQSAVTPGQAVVFYDDTRVLGGGWIETRKTVGSS